MSRKRKRQENQGSPIPLRRSKRLMLFKSRSILNLNDDCLLMIFQHFELLELTQLESVCKRFQYLVHESYKNFHRQDYDDLYIFTNLEKFFPKIAPYVEIFDAPFSCTSGDLTSFIKLISQCPRLKEVCIEGRLLNHFRRMTDQNRESMLSKIFLETLKKIEFYDCHLNDQLLYHLDNVESINFSHCEIVGNWFTSLRGMKAICFNHTMIEVSQFVKICENNSNLRELGLSYCMFFEENTDRCLSEITDNLVNLEKVEIVNWTYDPETVEAFNLQDFTGFADFPNLTDLKLVGIKNSENLMQRLADRDILKHLEIYEFTESSRSTLLAIARFSQLETLKITRYIDDENLLKLSSTSTLKEIDLESSNLHDAAVCQFVQKCKKLRKIYLTRCKNITDNLVDSLSSSLMEEDRSHQLILRASRTQITKKVYNRVININIPNL